MRYDVTHQKHLVISTCGFWTSKGNYDAVIPMFDHFCGKDKYTAVLCGQGELFSVPELKGRTDAYLETVRRAGAEYAAGGIRAGTQAKLAEPLYPRDVFEKMADASWGIAKGEMRMCQQMKSHFATQMAAYIDPTVWAVLEFHYTDIDKTYQFADSKGQK